MTENITGGAKKSSSSTTQTNVVVSSITIKDIRPKLEGSAAKLLPNVLFPESCEFVISGVNVSIANGIRRAISSEVKAKQLTFDLDDFETNDPYAKLNDFIQTIIRSIPIKQNVSSDLVLKLDFKNGTDAPKYVTSGDFTNIGKSSAQSLFDNNIPIVRISPNKFIKINKIYVAEGYEHEHGTFCISSGASCVPLDIDMYNMYTKNGVSASIANPRKHKISFETNGDIKPKLLVYKACDEIITRLGKIIEMLYTLQQIDDYHKLIIPGENDTTGMIIHYTVCDLYPDIPAITPNVDHINKVLTIRIRATDPNDVLASAIKHAMVQLEKIKSAFA